MPAVYRSPGDSPEQNTTDYLAITGPGLIFDGAKTSKISDIVDGTSNTILLVEANNRKVNWMEPVDIDVQEIGLGPKNGSGGDGISGKYSSGVNVLFADGSVQTLNNQSGLMNLNELLTKSGGEVINR
jgi:prepilin-type processing-associated H-X9-DG protein